MQRLDGAVLIELRRSLWEIAYASVVVLGCVGFYFLSTLDDGPVQTAQLYLAAGCAAWGLLVPFFRRLTLIDLERSELVRERSLFIMFHRSVRSFQAQAIRLEREVWFSEARHDHYYRILIACGDHDVHLGRVKGDMRALALAEKIAACLDVVLLDETEEIRRVLPYFGVTGAHYYDKKRPVV